MVWIIDMMQMCFSAGNKGTRHTLTSKLCMLLSNNIFQCTKSLASETFTERGKGGGGGGGRGLKIIKW